MTKPLQKLTVAVTEHRYAREFASLIERFGAQLYICPLLEEKPVDNRGEIQSFIRGVLSGSLDMMLFLTGVGARFLIQEAESMGSKDAFLSALRNLTVVARGPKPVSALHRVGVSVDITPETPTSEGLVETLKSYDLRGKRIGVQLYGTSNEYLCEALQQEGATVFTVQVYSYGSASDRSGIETLIEKLLAGHFHVITFTSAPQVRLLFQAAEELGLVSALRDRLNNGTAVAVVGEVTNRALVERGVVARIIPKEPKMGPMAQAIAEFFEKRDR